jgi:hypothetical protein
MTGDIIAVMASTLSVQGLLQPHNVPRVSRGISEHFFHGAFTAPIPTPEQSGGAAVDAFLGSMVVEINELAHDAAAFD